MESGYMTSIHIMWPLFQWSAYPFSERLLFILLKRLAVNNWKNEISWLSGTSLCFYLLSRIGNRLFRDYKYFKHNNCRYLVPPTYRNLATIADINNKNQVSCVLIFADTVNISVDISSENCLDIRFISQLRGVNPNLWICPFYCLKAAFFGPTIWHLI